MKKNSKHTDESRKRMSDSLRGHPPNSGSFVKGQPSWNKGKPNTWSNTWTEKEKDTLRQYYPLEGDLCYVRISRRTRGAVGRMASILQLKVTYVPNHHFTMPDKAKEKIAVAQRAIQNTPEAKNRKSLRMRGSNHPNWRGGISNRYCKYGSDWTKTLREAIKQRDNYTCRKCGLTFDDISTLRWNLVVHHIDYDHSNHNPSNLLSLCSKCHGATNYNRSHWTSFFRAMTTEPVSSEMEVEKP